MRRALLKLYIRCILRPKPCPFCGALPEFVVGKKGVECYCQCGSFFVIGDSLLHVSQTWDWAVLLRDAKGGTDEG